MSYLNAENLSKTSPQRPSQLKKFLGQKEGAGKSSDTQSKKGRTPTSRNLEDRDAIQRFLSYANIQPPCDGGLK